MDKSFKNFSHLTTDEFILNEEFLDWVKKPDAEKNAFWNAFLDSYPHQTRNVQLARTLIEELVNDNKKVIASETTKNKIWKQVKDASRTPVRRLNFIRWTAAACLILITAGIFYTYTSHNLKTFTTAFGEKATYILPDKSTVLLNPNSKLTYKTNWKENEVREVWIEGEAFLQVVHLKKQEEAKPSDRFIVHLENLEVEVLGTSFTVNSRQENEQVILKTGAVKVSFKDKEYEEVNLVPGEVLACKKGQVPKKETVKSVSVTWDEKNLIFNQTPLDDVFRTLKDNYGWNIKVTDKSVLKKTMTGSISTLDEKVLLKTLELAMNLDITRDDNTLFISEKK